MSGRPPKPRKGSPVKHAPAGFPIFFDKRKPRIVTADPWAFLAHLVSSKLTKEREGEALAFIEQAFDFYETAQNPQLGSKPLLYYYSFLNLAKVAILINKVDLPLVVHHGISDPRANERKRLRFEGQQIHMTAPAHNHSEVFPEFLKVLGVTTVSARTLYVINVLELIPSIHRTYVTVTKSNPIFVPVSRFELMHASGNVWARLILDSADNDVQAILPKLRKRQAFKALFDQVEAEDSGELLFETKTEPGHRRGLDNGILALVTRLRRLGTACILTSQGYRFYLPDVAPSEQLPCLAASYAAMFYFGSITRYKPHYFDKIVGGKYRWVVEELLATQPVQFLYKLASHLAGVDVVRPYATV